MADQTCTLTSTTKTPTIQRNKNSSGKVENNDVACLGNKVHNAGWAFDDGPVALKPSQIVDCYWVSAQCRVPCKAPTPRCGKWMLFVPLAEVDTTWVLIKSETECGKLGPSAKVATVKPSPLAWSGDSKLICVYTYDHTHVEDVFRVRERLKELGFTQKLKYKTDESTRKGDYARSKKQKVCIYED